MSCGVARRVRGMHRGLAGAGSYSRIVFNHRRKNGVPSFPGKHEQDWLRAEQEILKRGKRSAVHSTRESAGRWRPNASELRSEFQSPPILLRENSLLYSDRLGTFSHNQDLQHSSRVTNGSRDTQEWF
jgi:hypothetical protein